MKANTLFRNIYGLLGLFIVTFFFSPVALAQKGDIKITKTVDAFTSHTTLSTPQVKLASGINWQLKTYFLVKENIPYLAMYYSIDYNPASIGSCSILFTTGESLAKKDAVLINQTDEGFGFTASTSVFPLTQAELEKFAKTPIEKMRGQIAFSVSSHHDVTLKQKTAEELQKSATAILLELSQQKLAGL